MARSYLDKVYAARSTDEIRQIYDGWADSYDSEVGDAGYATPARCAAALAAVIGEHDAPILDFGCGTGMSGAAIAALGFSRIDGMDVSAAMLEKARARGLYRRLERIDPDAPIPVARGAYRAIAAVGVIGAGAAPLAVLDELAAALDPGGFLVFSLNEHTLRDPASDARVAALVDGGAFRQVARTLGDHLPEIGLKSLVYLLERR